jgi:hypothetical protein
LGASAGGGDEKQQRRSSQVVPTPTRARGAETAKEKMMQEFLERGKR